MEPLCAEIITLKLPWNFLPCAGLQELMGTLQKWWISKKTGQVSILPIVAHLFSFFIAEPLKT